MQVRDMFHRDIARQINGVVKADQRDDSAVWQELDEFVLTNELDKHLRELAGAMANSLDGPRDSTMADRNGVWVSGFFGSGKSHLIKVLTFLLNDKPVQWGGQSKRPIEFFEGKVVDQLFLSDLRKLATNSCDAVLFNIDSKADRAKGDHALLDVFQRVFNEMQGFCPDHPHIAAMESYLKERGKLAAFHAEFEKASGQPWLDARDGYVFHLDELKAAFSKASGQSELSAATWLDKQQATPPLTPENFAKRVKKYLDSKPPSYRIYFIADEIGQFVGSSSALMLNLQTIVEDLGVQCGGRAWVVVTSQENIDSVVMGLSGSRSNDFSKIQGRFVTRLHLSSANTDEVIQQRLLKKRPEATASLIQLYHDKGSIVDNQLTFTDVKMTLKGFSSGEDFAANYPFAPFQFQLVQKVFEEIRTTGYSGLHLSKGERSMLDAFQSGAKQVRDAEQGVLVPFYRFYASIESFLGTSVSRTIQQARLNPSLNDFDIQLLQTLFLIRQINELPGTIDNLATLLVDRVDTDKAGLKAKIEKALTKLVEQETLVGRSGNRYHFLTNEEQEIGNQIKHQTLEPGLATRELGKIVYQEVLADKFGKHEVGSTKVVTKVNNSLDGLVCGQNRLGADFHIKIITPLSEEHSSALLLNGAVTQSAEHGGCAVFVLPNNPDLKRELHDYLMVERYIDQRADSGLPESTKSIHSKLREENRERRNRLKSITEDMLRDSRVWICGSEFKEPNRNHPATLFDSALKHLEVNLFTKHGMLQLGLSNLEQEVHFALNPNNPSPRNPWGPDAETYKAPLQEVRSVINAYADRHEQMTLGESLIERFHSKPYGWEDKATLLLIARLLAAGEIAAYLNGAEIDRADLAKTILETGKWRKITIQRRAKVDASKFQAARKLGQDLFGKEGPDQDDLLQSFLREEFKGWVSNLDQHRLLAEHSGFPALKAIKAVLSAIIPHQGQLESGKYFDRLLEEAENLREAAEDYRDIHQFYTKQRNAWSTLRDQYHRFDVNRKHLELDPAASRDLAQMKNALEAEAPWTMLKDAPTWSSRVEAVNDQLVTTERTNALATIERRIAEVEKQLADAKLTSPEIHQRCLRALQNQRSAVSSERSIAHIRQEADSSGAALDAAMYAIRAEIDRVATEAQASGASSPPRVKAAETVPVEMVARSSVNKSYLDSQEDLETFMKELRKQCEQILAKDKRIRIS